MKEKVEPGMRLRRYDPAGDRFDEFVVRSVNVFGRVQGRTERGRNVVCHLTDIFRATRENGEPRFEVVREGF
jgi:hypothetical protein